MAKPGNKIFHDPIHGSMEFESALVKIIDTPEFQRLRRIKQLGGGCYVYPGATHTRFEHSLGVCHLAGKFAKHLIDTAKSDKLDMEYPEGISEEETIMCIKVAGLCHDLGHGPFSHMFQDFAQKVTPEWKHEDMSVIILGEILEDVQKTLKDGDADKELITKLTAKKEFIADLIRGSVEKAGKRHFLYQIVANKDTGVDVDKWDYFARDCHYLGLSNDFQWMRCMMLARVKKVNGQDDPNGQGNPDDPDDPDGPDDYQVCYRDSDVANIYTMFRTRSTLHQKAYQHVRVKAVEHMMIDCLLCMKDCKLQKVLEDIIQHKDKSEKKDEVVAEAVAVSDKTDAENKDETFAEAVAVRDKADAENKEAFAEAVAEFVKLDDSIVESFQKQVNGTKEQKRAFELIDRLRRRKLYCYRGFAKMKMEKNLTEKDIRETLHLEDDHFAISVVKVKFGSETENPLGKLWFYPKDVKQKPFQLSREESEQILLGGLLLPAQCQPQYEVRFYCKEEATETHNHDSCLKYIKDGLATDTASKVFGKPTGKDGYFSMTEGK